MERGFQHDFSRVRLHTDARAAASARALGARAYTVGRHVVMGAEASTPDTLQGRRLLAHELAHVVQQSHAEPVSGAVRGLDPAQDASAEARADQAAARVSGGGTAVPAQLGMVRSPALQRERIGTQVSHPSGATSPFRAVEATFNGSEFTVLADGVEILRVSGQSGRPYSVRPADATACGGSTDDSYMNNPRYVGVPDNGPIPEGEYRFRVSAMTTFDFTERMRMLGGGTYTDPMGRTLHGGDWGAGRVALQKVRVLPSPTCGNTATRSGFYLHGGIMPGSSGCIDIGNSGFETLVQLLQGYRGTVRVTVTYRGHAAPEVGAIDRALGRMTYPAQENPTVWDRLQSLFGGGD